MPTTGDNFHQYAGPDNMDEVDLAFMKSITPEDALPLGFIAISKYLTSQGQPSFNLYAQMDATLTEMLGHLEIAKLVIVRRVNPFGDPPPGGITG